MFTRVAPVQHGHAGGTLARRGPHAVHSGVAAADHHHALARGVVPSVVEAGHVVAQPLAVAGRQVVHRRHDPCQPGAGAADVARLVNAGGDQHGVVPGAQVGEGEGLAQLHAQVELDAALLQQPPAAQHDLLLQLEAGDAVDHQPAHAVVAVVNVDLVALGPQPFRSRQPARPGADDPHRLWTLPPGGGRLHPALLPRVVGDEPFHRADGDAVEALLDDAVALAQPVLRADAAANLGKGVGGAADLVGFLQAVLSRQLQPVRYVVPQGAVNLAERHAALAAPAALRPGLRRVEVGIDFGEVLAPHRRFALGGRFLRQADELQHAVGHRHSSSKWPQAAAGRGRL